MVTVGVDTSMMRCQWYVKVTCVHFLLHLRPARPLFPPHIAGTLSVVSPTNFSLVSLFFSRNSPQHQQCFSSLLSRAWQQRLRASP